jgi:4-amino-4-deoxy-L-arabinose transferase-like glycosyltransferase
VLPFIGPAWRTRAYAATAGVMVAVALPLCAAWPLALRARDPALFEAWRASETLFEYFAPLGPSDDFNPWYVIRNLLWFAWPALPLVGWTLWIRGRNFNGGLAQPGIQVPAVLALVMFASLSVGANPVLSEMLPLLIPLALLASLEVDTLKRGFSGALDWFGILTFGLLAIVFWGLWIDAYMHGMSLRVARVLKDTEIGYQPSFKLWAMCTALFLTLLWIALVRPARKSNRRALLNWAAGVVLLWGLYSTIWLPYLDSRRSYRIVATSLQTQLPGGGCVAGRNLGDPQRALFEYFSGIVTVPEASATGALCNALLVQYSRQAVEPIPGWTLKWEGGRRGDDTERFALYLRNPR